MAYFCFQYRCIHSLLLARDIITSVTVATWLSRDGTSQIYWGGATSRRDFYCACGETREFPSYIKNGLSGYCCTLLHCSLSSTHNRCTKNSTYFNTNDSVTHLVYCVEKIEHVFFLCIFCVFGILQ